MSASIKLSLSLSELILICGSGLEAYSALQSLLTGGVDPALITFVRPHLPTCFTNEAVEERVQRSLEESGVRLFSGHTLSEVGEGGVCLAEEGDAIFIECQV